MVNNLWEWKYEGSEQMIREQIESGLGMGVYREADESLMGWAILLRHGDLGAVYVRPEFRSQASLANLSMNYALVRHVLSMDLYAMWYSDRPEKHLKAYSKEGAK